MNTTLLIIATIASTLACATPQAVPPPPANPAVDGLLDRLEESATTLDAFTANVWYEVYNDLLGSREIRTGKVIFRQDRETGQKEFALIFDKLMTGAVGAGRMRLHEREQHYIFDGQWLAEVDPEKRSFVKHQIVPPGKELNPLKLGEGPFPLPIGQPKSQVLTLFDVQPLGPPQNGPLARLNEDHELDSLLLIPRTGTREARDYVRVEVHYDHDTLLPVGMVLTEKGGNRKTVKLTSAVRNPELSAEQATRLVISEPDPTQWAVSVQPWRGQ
jgi:hypothetical protein